MHLFAANSQGVVFDQSAHLFTFWRWANNDAYIFTTSGLDLYFIAKMVVENNSLARA
jgi:hypothetical protein